MTIVICNTIKGNDIKDIENNDFDRRDDR